MSRERGRTVKGRAAVTRGDGHVPFRPSGFFAKSFVGTAVVGDRGASSSDDGGMYDSRRHPRYDGRCMTGRRRKPCLKVTFIHSRYGKNYFFINAYYSTANGTIRFRRLTKRFLGVPDRGVFGTEIRSSKTPRDSERKTFSRDSRDFPGVRTRPRKKHFPTVVRRANTRNRCDAAIRRSVCAGGETRARARADDDDKLKRTRFSVVLCVRVVFGRRPTGLGTARRHARFGTRRIFVFFFVVKNDFVLTTMARYIPLT